MTSIPYSLENPGTAFCMPTFNIALELLASVINPIVIIFIMNRPCQAITKHSSCERGKGVDRIRFQELCDGGSITLRIISIAVGRDTKLIELVLGLK
jgi:hypothetical protein